MAEPFLVATINTRDYLFYFRDAVDHAFRFAAMPQQVIVNPRRLSTTPPIERPELAALLVAADWFEELGAPEADALRRLAETLKGLNGPAGAILAALESFGVKLPENACVIVDATLLAPSDIVEMDYRRRPARLLPRRRAPVLTIEMELYPTDAAGPEANAPPETANREPPAQQKGRRPSL